MQGAPGQGPAMEMAVIVILLSAMQLLSEWGVRGPAGGGGDGEVSEENQIPGSH